MRSTNGIKARRRRGSEREAVATAASSRYGVVAMTTTFQPTTASAAVQGLPQVFDPAAAEGVEAVVLFDLSGREPGQWTVIVRDATCRVATGRTMEPTVTLHMDSDLWLAIARGEKSGRDAFMNGEYTVDGDVVFMMRFGKIFPVK
jgi:putative sterol carrier protein